MAKGHKTGGRMAGTPNRATAEVRALAQEHAPTMIQELVRLATQARSESARVAAIKELLDRGYGRPAQAINAEIAAADPITDLLREIGERMGPIPTRDRMGNPI